MGRFRDYAKCRKVLYSCQNLGQLVTAHSLIFQYGKTYNFNKLWSFLDREAIRLYENTMDRLDYQERCAGLD